MPALLVHLYPAMCIFYRAAVCANTGLHPSAVDAAIPTGITAVVVEAAPTPVPMPNPYTEHGAKRERSMGSAAEVTALKTGPNGKTVATAKATSDSGNMTSMFLVVPCYHPVPMFYNTSAATMHSSTQLS